MLLGYSIAQLIFGLRYNKKDNICLIEPKIPLYLLIGGAIGIPSSVIHLSTAFYALAKKNKFCARFSTVSWWIGSIAMTVVYCIGSYWIFHNFTTVQYSNPQLSTYCDATLYKTAYTFTFIFDGFIVLAGFIRVVKECAGVEDFTW
jgi:hypothetical protein